MARDGVLAEVVRLDDEVVHFLLEVPDHFAHVDLLVERVVVVVRCIGRWRAQTRVLRGDRADLVCPNSIDLTV